ncbi:hypothetical protein [Kocuria coralli]|nr:hypothetical protein [Kocuria coralli]
MLVRIYGMVPGVIAGRRTVIGLQSGLEVEVGKRDPGRKAEAAAE